MSSNERVGRFSTGQETLHVSPQDVRIGRFSDGQATRDGVWETASIGRFSTGQESLAESAEHVRVGSFHDRHVRRPLGTLIEQPEATDRREVERAMS